MLVHGEDMTVSLDKQGWEGTRSRSHKYEQIWTACACLYVHTCTHQPLHGNENGQTWSLTNTDYPVLHIAPKQCAEFWFVHNQRLVHVHTHPLPHYPSLRLGGPPVLHPHYVIHVHANKISHARLSEASYLTCTVIYHNKGLTCKCSLEWIVKLCSGSVKQRACLWKWYLILELEPIFGPFRCSIGFNDSLRIDHKDWKRKSSDNMWICYLHLQ